jgi:hypothetical protein
MASKECEKARGAKLLARLKVLDMVPGARS